MDLRVKEILKAKGITQKKLAEKLDISVVALSRIINGNPTLETLKKIADALGVEVKELFANSTKDNDLFVLRDGKYVNVGKIDLTTLKDTSTKSEGDNPKK